MRGFFGARVLECALHKIVGNASGKAADRSTHSSGSASVRTCVRVCVWQRGGHEPTLAAPLSHSPLLASTTPDRQTDREARSTFNRILSCLFILDHCHQASLCIDIPSPNIYAHTYTGPQARTHARTHARGAGHSRPLSRRNSSLNPSIHLSNLLSDFIRFSIFIN